MLLDKLLKKLQRVKDMEQQPDEYKVQLDENPPGTFTAEGCVYAKMINRATKLNLFAIGRS